MANDHRPRVKTDRYEAAEPIRIMEWLGFVRDEDDGRYVWWRLDFPEGMSLLDWR